MFEKADTHVESSGAAAPPPAATLDKEDADTVEALDVRDARDDDAARDMMVLLDVDLLLTMRVQRSDANEAVIM